MNQEPNSNEDADAYYGDDSAGSEELDLSFLDQNDDGAGDQSQQ